MTIVYVAGELHILNYYYHAEGCSVRLYIGLKRSIFLYKFVTEVFIFVCDNFCYFNLQLRLTLAVT